MTEEDIRLCVDALWDNAIDGRLADLRWGSDFDKAERHLRKSFEYWLRLPENQK